MRSTCFGHKYIHHQEFATILLNYHVGHIVLGSMCVGVLVWLGWSGIRVEGQCMLEFRCGWVGVVFVLQADVCWSFGVVGLA